MSTRLVTPHRRQHTVSRVVLSRFAVDSRVAVYDRRADAIYRKGVRGLFWDYLDQYDSWAAEERWGQVESLMPAVYTSIDDRSVLGDAAAVQALRDLVALHWVRNSALRAKLLQIQRDVTLTAMDRRRGDADLLAGGYRQSTGLVAAGKQTLEWFNEKVHHETAAGRREELLSGSLQRLFHRAQHLLAPHQVQVGYSKSADFLIGDSPVITTKPGHDGVGPHQGVALGEATMICMPVDPHTIIALAPTPGYVDVDADTVATYNQLQMRGFTRWVGCRPGGSADDHLRATTVARSTWA